jgi:ubiquinone/menaquinone biosynthesis C-methylase UbiE
MKAPLNSPSPAARRNQQAMQQREALFRRFGYDSAASLEFVLAHALPLPGHVLEIGTGKGRFLAALAQHAERVTTLDVDAAQQRAARLHVRQTHAGRRIRFVVGDAGHLPWPDASFDTVASLNTFHHLAHPLRVFQEMLRVLKPGGKLVLGDFSPRGFQIFDRIHRAEGGTHPRLKNGLADFAQHLRRRGWKTKRSKGCNQELLVANAPTSQRKQ